MKRWLILFVLLILVVSMIIPVFAYTVKPLPQCPVCGLYGAKTGNATYQFGKLYVQYKCAYNHVWWQEK